MARWAELTEDRLEAIAARRDQAAGEVQEAHGVHAEAAERQVDRQEGRSP